jgi:hypothetical protein
MTTLLLTLSAAACAVGASPRCPTWSPWTARIRPRYRGLLITRQWLMLPAGMHRDLRVLRRWRVGPEEKFMTPRALKTPARHERRLSSGVAVDRSMPNAFERPRAPSSSSPKPRERGPRRSSKSFQEQSPADESRGKHHHNGDQYPRVTQAGLRPSLVGPRGFKPLRQGNGVRRRGRSGSLIVRAERCHRGIRGRNFVAGSPAVDVGS